jgi:C-terminal processing protease CtpA/Prc
VPRICTAAIALLATQFAVAQQSGTETDRLLATGKLWITVKYFHPYLAYRDIDWDKALVDALPKIRGAAGPDDYAAAVQTMLDALRDPATYVMRESKKHDAASIQIEKTPNGTLIVSQSQTAGSGRDPVQDLSKAIASAQNIVFDLRAGETLSALLDRPDIRSTLASVPLDGPAQQMWVHNGLAPESGTGFSGSYYSAFQMKAGARIASSSAAASDHKMSFILGENSWLPEVGSALFTSGRAAVLVESPHYRIASEEVCTVTMGQGVQAVVRLSEPLLWRPVKKVSHDGALQEAIAALEKPFDPPQGRAAASAPLPQKDRSYAENRYPSTEYRILAGYKIWGVFHYFFAYRDLMDEDWDDVFPAFLPKFIAAKDAREYNLTISDMVTHVADSHAFVQSDELDEYFGKAPVGLRLRLIEKKPIITEILDEEAKKAGIQVGDIVAKVDGEGIIERINREAGYIAASTPQSLGNRVMQRILNGPDGSMAALAIGGQDGRTREVSLKRRTDYITALRSQRGGDVIKMLAGNIGYADLDRLKPEQVDAMFDKFRDTKAIIFDMRGYPYGTAWSIAPRLTGKEDVGAAIFTGPLALTPDVSRGSLLTSTASYFFVQKLPTSDKWKYQGKTVMLIDERTMSQAEHTGLFFEVANKTEFIGTPSAGANGDVTNFVVPGGVTISFSGHDVRHANGGKLQRLGLQPAVTVAPSVKGIRTGHDEVLEKAIEYVSK